MRRDNICPSPSPVELDQADLVRIAKVMVPLVLASTLVPVVVGAVLLRRGRRS